VGINPSIGKGMGNNTPLYDIYSSFESPNDHIIKEREGVRREESKEWEIRLTGESNRDQLIMGS